MKSIVVDSSVVVKWINQIDEGLLEQADKILSDANQGTINLLTPELSKYEIGNALIRKGLDLPLSLDALGTIYQLPLKFIPETEELASETYTLATKFGITYYDASFLSLAKQYGATLVTDNFKHQGKAKNIKVIPLSEY